MRSKMEIRRHLEYRIDQLETDGAIAALAKVARYMADLMNQVSDKLDSDLGDQIDHFLETAMIPDQPQVGNPTTIGTSRSELKSALDSAAENMKLNDQNQFGK